jgi:hypothetical protein
MNRDRISARTTYAMWHEERLRILGVLQKVRLPNFLSVTITIMLLTVMVAVTSRLPCPLTSQTLYVLLHYHYSAAELQGLQWLSHLITTLHHDQQVCCYNYYYRL